MCLTPRQQREPHTPQQNRDRKIPNAPAATGDPDRVAASASETRAATTEEEQRQQHKESYSECDSVTVYRKIRGNNKCATAGATKNTTASFSLEPR
jgi:hypothetical protein